MSLRSIIVFISAGITLMSCGDKKTLPQPQKTNPILEQNEENSETPVPHSDSTPQDLKAICENEGGHFHTESGHCLDFPVKYLPLQGTWQAGSSIFRFKGTELEIIHENPFLENKSLAFEKGTINLEDDSFVFTPQVSSCPDEEESLLSRVYLSREGKIHWSRHEDTLFIDYAFTDSGKGATLSLTKRDVGPNILLYTQECFQKESFSAYLSTVPLQGVWQGKSFVDPNALFLVDGEAVQLKEFEDTYIINGNEWTRVFSAHHSAAGLVAQMTRGFFAIEGSLAELKITSSSCPHILENAELYTETHTFQRRENDKLSLTRLGFPESRTFEILPKVPEFPEFSCFTSEESSEITN